MNSIRSLLFFGLFSSMFSMGFSQDYNRVDEVIKLYPDRFNTAKELSFFISRDFTSEDEKVRAIFSWIITNVSYDPDEYKKFDYSFKNYRERNEKEEKLRQKIIKRTLKTGKAVCEGYAMLFEKLCELQGVQNYLVRGDVKSNFEDLGRPFKRIHMWNVAVIEGKPYLFDATWGAGKWEGTFTKDPDYFYFKTPPEQFVKTHFPDMQEDAFLDNKLKDRQWFAQIPLIITKNLKLSDIKTPRVGILEADSYFDEIPFVIQSKPPKTISYRHGDSKKEITFDSQGDTISFTVPITGKKQHILLYFDDKPALAYKIK